MIGLLLALNGCGTGDDANRIDVTVIGESPRLADPDRTPLNRGSATLLRETAMGLVSFDSSGQVEPALAESWIVSDDGRSIIFRIQRKKWPNGDDVTGEEVAASLRRAIAASSENRLKPLLTSIDAVVGMTGRVVEIRLKTPRPYLLQLLAQPELGIRRDGAGAGPWRIAGHDADAIILRPAPDPTLATDDDAPTDDRVIYLKSGRAALAVARFMQNRSHLVLGGSAADWPIAQVSGVGRGRLHVEPAEGLFGLAVFGKIPMLKERSLREALAMAIDRDTMIEDFDVPGWTAMTALLPSRLDSGQAASTPVWSTNTIATRRVTARQRIAAWTAVRGPIAPLRIALPHGPGMRLVFARIAADWRAIGVPVVLVPFGSKNTDLRLIDEVAPNSSANWYLTRTGCDNGLVCSETGKFDLVESRAASTLGARSAAIARADAVYAGNSGYIALAKPLRWTMVSPLLTRYRDNAFASHPFAELRPDQNQN